MSKLTFNFPSIFPLLKISFATNKIGDGLIWFANVMSCFISVLTNPTSPRCNANSSFKKDLIDIFKFNLLRSVDELLKLIFGFVTLTFNSNFFKSSKIFIFWNSKSKLGLIV